MNKGVEQAPMAGGPFPQHKETRSIASSTMPPPPPRFTDRTLVYHRLPQCLPRESERVNIVVHFFSFVIYFFFTHENKEIPQ